MSEENIDLMWRALRHVEEGDMTGVLAYCDETIEIEQAIEVPGAPARHHGHAGVLEVFAVWPDQWEDFSIEVLRVRDIADDVVVTMMNRGRGRETAIPVEAQFSHVVSIRDEKVVRWRIFMREEDALKAVGLEE